MFLAFDRFTIKAFLGDNLNIWQHLIKILGCFSKYKNFEALKLFKSF